MQVFKLYFKVLRRYMRSIFLYGGIFLGILMGVIIPQTTKNESKNYVQAKSNFAVFDYEESELSAALVGYLSEHHTRSIIKDDTKESIQDELFNKNVDCVIKINVGFEEAFKAGNASEYMELYEIPNEMGPMLLKQNLNSYLSVVNSYMTAGFDLKEAIEKSVEATEVSVDVEMLKEGGNERKPVQYFYTYLSWVVIAMCVEGLASVLLAIDKKEVRNRIECSSYKFVKMNMEVLAGVLVTGIAIWAVCVGLSFAAFSEDMLKGESVFYMLNALCVMLVALAITFVVSKLTENQQVISLLTNVIGLGMAFLCGVFVPLELVGDAAIKIARFLPVYWNVKAVDLITAYEPSKVGTLLSYMGIQILFAAAILCVGMIIAKRKRGVVA